MRVGERERERLGERNGELIMEPAVLSVCNRVARFWPAELIDPDLINHSVERKKHRVRPVHHSTPSLS